MVPVHERAANVGHFLQFLVEMFQTRCEVGTVGIVQPEPLIFDARVVPFQDFTPVAGVFQDALVCTLKKFLCVTQLTCAQVRNAMLPLVMGGLGPWISMFSHYTSCCFHRF